MEAVMSMENRYTGIFVSIIVPVYNVKKYLGRCVRSLTHQSHQNIEIILVDDGSTDGSSELCDVLAVNDQRIQVIHKQNEGLGEARNTGIDAAKGEWICFVDSDDFVAERFVEILLQAAVYNDVLYAQCRFERGTKEFLPELAHETETKIFNVDDFYRYCFITKGHSVYTCWNNIYHHSIFDKIRFLPIRHTEDVPFVQECIDFCADKGFAVVNQIMYYWYQREGSIMNRTTELNRLNQIKAYEIVLDFWKERDKKIIYDMFFNTYFSCLIDAYTLLRRDLPEEREKYEFLKDKIKGNLYDASRMSNGKLVLAVGNFDFIQYLSERKVIMYGYGENGKRFLSWLLHFNVKISEIWDAKASGNDKVEGITLRRMHEGLLSDTPVILLTVEDENTKLLIKQNLINLGYRDILEWRCIEMGCRPRIYSEYLPFLMEGIV